MKAGKVFLQALRLFKIYVNTLEREKKKKIFFIPSVIRSNQDYWKKNVCYVGPLLTRAQGQNVEPMQIGICRVDSIVEHIGD